ncbi:hypothetical protein EMCRGX_G013281 [Ephydatia muelleri]
MTFWIVPILLVASAAHVLTAVTEHVTAERDAETNVKDAKRGVDFGTFRTQLHGGHGGSAFDHFSSGIQGAKIKAILIRSGKMIDSIQVVYKVPEAGKDETKITDVHGGKGGTEHIFEIDVDHGEFITDVFGRSGRLVDKLWFLTNKGRVLGPVGGDGGVMFHESCRLRGFFGRSGKMLDSIGFHSEFIEPHQFGVACSNGAEKIAHGLRACVNKYWLDDDFVVLKVDMKNAFNMVSREAILSECSKHFPELLHLVLQSAPFCGTLWATYIQNKGFSRVIPLVLCSSPWF